MRDSSALTRLIQPRLRPHKKKDLAKCSCVDSQVVFLVASSNLNNSRINSQKPLASSSENASPAFSITFTFTTFTFSPHRGSLSSADGSQSRLSPEGDDDTRPINPPLCWWKSPRELTAWWRLAWSDGFTRKNKITFTTSDRCGWISSVAAELYLKKKPWLF